MKDYATKDDVQEIVNKAVGDLSEIITSLATNMDERFQQVDERFQQVDERFQQVDERFNQVDERFDRIEGKLTSLEKGQREMREWLERIDARLGGVESDIAEIYDRIVVLEKKYPKVTKTELKELENKLARIIDWAKIVSVETGVPLPKI